MDTNPRDKRTQRRRRPDEVDLPPVPLQTPLDVLCFMIIKARTFDAKEGVVEDDPGSNPADDGERGILEDYADDPTLQELREALDNLNEDQKIEVLALVWLGRGDFDRFGWKDALAAAGAAHNARETDYLTSTPLLGDYLEEGMYLLGHDCHDVELSHL